MSLPFDKDLTEFKVYLRPGKTSFRLGLSGLLSLILGTMTDEMDDKSLFIFCSSSKKQLRIIYKEGQGAWLLQRRIFKGTFYWPDTVKDSAEISYETLQSYLRDPVPLEMLQIENEINNVELYL
jgi:hypothetical protein